MSLPGMPGASELHAGLARFRSRAARARPASRVTWRRASVDTAVTCRSQALRCDRRRTQCRRLRDQISAAAASARGCARSASYLERYDASERRHSRVMAGAAGRDRLLFPARSTTGRWWAAARGRAGRPTWSKSVRKEADVPAELARSAVAVSALSYNRVAQRPPAA